jgi:hypothetical protein
MPATTVPTYQPPLNNTACKGIQEMVSRTGCDFGVPDVLGRAFVEQPSEMPVPTRWRPCGLGGQKPRRAIRTSGPETSVAPQTTSESQTRRVTAQT